MTNNSIHALTNLASGHAIDLPVAPDQDPAAAARAHLEASDLPEHVRQGFYVSVYPTGQDNAESAGNAPAAASASTPRNSDWTEATLSEPAEIHDQVTADEDERNRELGQDYDAPGTVGLLPKPARNTAGNLVDRENLGS